MAIDLLHIYADKIAAGALVADPGQNAALAALQALCARLETPATRSWLRSSRAAAPRGIYLYGAVGRGKSMLMDLFFAHAPVEKKRRVHFHAFMLEVHATLHKMRQKERTVDPLPQIAKAIVAQHTLLCFDEFYVTDIADAMILSRLFTTLFAEGLVLVATSNFAPDSLYNGGLQRQLFVPFIDVLKTHAEVVAVAGAIDHRLARLCGWQVFHTPLNAASTALLAEQFATLTDRAEMQPVTLDAQGRQTVIPKAAQGVAWMDFADLCGQPLGAADYLALAESFHTLVLDGVPQMKPEQRNEAVRFTNLIDALYEAKVKLIMASAVPTGLLHPQGQHAPIFQRTASRLQEMRSADYLALPHRLLSVT